MSNKTQNKQWNQYYRYSLSPTYICCTPVYNHKKRRNKQWFTAESRRTNRPETGGKISEHARKKLSKAINWLVAGSSWKTIYSKKHNKHFKSLLTFVTLTLPGQGEKTDKEIKSILHSWLQFAKVRFGLKTYVWKAEAQKRGTIHFHVTTNIFIPKNQLQFSWNRLLGHKDLLNGLENPPSTKVHSVRNIKNIKTYLIKYFCKSENDRRIINGRLWGCSYDLSRARKTNIIVDEKESQSIADELRNENHKTIQGDYFYMWLLNREYWKRKDESEMKCVYVNEINKIRHNSFPFMRELYTVN